MMKSVRFGKGQGLADEAGQSLAQGVVPAFHVSRLATLLAHTAMRLLGKDLLVRLPEIAEGQTMLVLGGNLVPQAATRFLAAVTDHKGHNLVCAATNGRPQPSFSTLFQHKRPKFIEFEHIIGFGGQQGVFESRQGLHDFSDPARDCLSGNIEDALQSTHTGAFLVCPHDHFLLLFFMNALGLQNSIGLAILAVVLRIPALVGAVLDNIRAAADATAIGNGDLYHVINDTPSLTFLPLPTSVYPSDLTKRENDAQAITM